MLIIHDTQVDWLNIGLSWYRVVKMIVPNFGKDESIGKLTFEKSEVMQDGSDPNPLG